MIKIKYNKFKNLNISALGFGAMRFPMKNGQVDIPLTEKMIGHAISKGINYFDTAWIYHDGDSETILGDVLKKYPRNDFHIATKLPFWEIDKPEDMERILNKQLEKLQMDYIDFYLLHSLNLNSYNYMMEQGAYEFLCKKRDEGIIKYFGFSIHAFPHELEVICSEHKWDFAQIQYNYLDVLDQRADEMYDILERYNIPCIVMEPLRGGGLSSFHNELDDKLLSRRPNASISSWGLRFCASKPNVLVTLSGMSNLEQLNDNIKTFTDFEQLSDDEYNLLMSIAKEYKAKSLIPCTGCRYCIDCAQGVDIPQIFRVYNLYLNNNSYWFHDDYAKIEGEGAHGGKCTDCGQCNERCPQNIDVSAEIKKIHAFYRK